MIKLIELFAGIGSQTQALKNLGVPHEVVAVSEIDKYAIKSYEALHGPVNNLGDITKIPELPAADMWTYSFPCQDISVAGKLAGIRDGTRSGLLLHVERLLAAAEQNGTLPKYLLLENVKNLVGKKFKASFDNWLAFLSALGYTNYWQILNAKHYGIPQNRERVFCLSIRGEHQPYKFPEKQELLLRLRDLIDDVVDEKYYLSEKALSGLLTTNFSHQKRRVQKTDVCRTLMARDYKDPSCIEVGNLTGEKWDKMHDISRRVYGTDGVAPTVHCCGGGNTEPKIIEDFYSAREPRVYEDVAPTLRSERNGLKVVAGQYQPVDRDYNKKGTQRAEHFECRSDELSNAVLTGDRKNCVKIVAMRGRNPDNPSDRTPGIHLEQTLEENSQGLCNALTTVQKDNLVMEESYVGRKYRDFIEENGYVPEMFNAYNGAEIKDVSPTLTTQCGSSTASGNVLKAELSQKNAGKKYAYIMPVNTEIARTVRVGGHGDLRRHSWDVLEVETSALEIESVIGSKQKNAYVGDGEISPTLTEAMGMGGGQTPMIEIKENTRKGYAEAEPGDFINVQYHSSETRRGRVGKDVSQTVMCTETNAVVAQDTRIRKLTPRECLRLMGWTDEQIDRIEWSGVSNTQMYKQAGNGIVVQVLEAIFKVAFAEHLCR